MYCMNLKNHFRIACLGFKYDQSGKDIVHDSRRNVITNLLSDRVTDLPKPEMNNFSKPLFYFDA